MRMATRFFLLGATLGVSHVASAAWSDLLDVIGRDRGEARLQMIDLHELVVVEARRNGVSPDFLAAILQIESFGRPCAVSSAGAVGLGQLMPATAARYGVHDRFQPVANVRATATHLAEMLRLTNGNFPLAAALYNGGERIRYLPPSQWPLETREYANRRLPRTLSAFQGDGWRRHLVRYVPNVDYGRCAMRRAS